MNSMLSAPVAVSSSAAAAAAAAAALALEAVDIFGILMGADDAEAWREKKARRRNKTLAMQSDGNHTEAASIYRKVSMSCESSHNCVFYRKDGFHTDAMLHRNPKTTCYTLYL